MVKLKTQFKVDKAEPFQKKTVGKAIQKVKPKANFPIMRRPFKRSFEFRQG